MMNLFGKMFAKHRAIDPEGQRIIGATMDTGDVIFAPKGHSMTLGGTGAGKSTSVGVPAIMSLIASEPEKAVLVLDGKQGEFAIQLARMIAALGRKVAVIDDFGVWPVLAPYRISLNPFGSVVATYKRDQRDVVFALEGVTQSLIEEPNNDAKNKYFRAWPRNIIEFAILALLKRNPDLATPGGAAALISDPDMLRGFAETEAEEGDAILQPKARAIRDMIGHEHWPQHLEEAQRALKLYSPGTRLAEIGRNPDITHEDLVREGYVVFLIGPQTKMLSLGSYYANHILSFSSAMLEGAGPLRIVADEVTNCPIKPLLEKITIVRSFGGEFSPLIGQSLSEFERKFGKDLTRTLLDNCATKQWLSITDPEVAESISKAMGEEHAVQSSLGSDSTSSKTQSNLSLTRQRVMSASELMTLNRDEQLVHISGIGYFICKKISQNQIAPYCHLIAENPLEGGKLPPDPKVTFVTPNGRLSQKQGGRS